MKAKVITLGCKTNQYDSHQLEQQLLALGYELSRDDPPADICIVNTCTVTHIADRKSRHAIRQAITENPQAKVYVTGCYAKLDPEMLLKIPGINLWANNPCPERSRGITAHQPNHPSLFPIRIRQNLAIEDGCNQFCSYCIVPFVRGRVKSRPIPELIDEARQMVAQGVKEIVLTGINLGAYDNDQQTLVDVIKALSTVHCPPSSDLPRIRLSSIEPMYVTFDLLKEVATNPKVCKHLHIPLQSGSDKILAAMHRPYTQEDFRQITEHAYNLIPDPGLTTDIIVGFPGETEKDFNATLDTINEIRFLRIHSFKYSPRKGTKAYELKDDVAYQEKERRRKAVNALSSKYFNQYISRFIGKNIEVLAECRGRRPDTLEGLTGNYIKVVFPGNKEQIGSLIKVTPNNLDSESLLAI